MENHIVTKNFGVSYGAEKALNGISLAIPDKKLTAIIGPSGCGKTTLLKSFNRLLEMNDGVRVSGEILIDGENIYGPGVELTHLRKKMGLLLQRPQVLPMSIFDNVAFGPRIHGTKNKAALCGIVEKYLRESSLWDEVKDRLDAPAARLSIGQQQRLCLARGLAVEPEAILGDEPTSALDPVSAERIERKFLELKEKYTVVLVTHNLRQARRLADHVVFLYLGNVIEQGPAEEFFRAPKDERTKSYLDGRFFGDGAAAPEAVLDLRGTICPDNFVKAKLGLEDLKNGDVLKLIVDYPLAVTEVPKAMEYDGHKVLDVKQVNAKDWEILIRKE